MLDKVLFPILRPAVKAGFTAANIICEVKQGYSPITAGMDTGPTLYLTKLFDREYGHAKKQDVWNAGTEAFDRTTTQRVESTWQGTAVYKQDATDLSAPTAADIAQAAVAVLQDDDVLAGLRDAGLALYRITQVRNLQILNGGLQNEAVPSFDFVITHNRVTTATTQGATPVALKIQGF